ncbi:MAG: molybdopterin cofactor-binding domain-containing protein [Gemmatimonadaceae bacterium]
MSSRRDFISQMGAGTVGLVIATYLPTRGDDVPPQVFSPNAYVQVDPDDAVTIWVARMEMGQGARTALAMVVAEELDVEWSRVRVAFAQPGGRFEGVQMHTSGSDSVADTFTPLRRAGAAARAMLVTAAAQRWRAPSSECSAHLGRVTHAPTQRSLRYGELVAAAAVLAVPDAPPLKPRSEYRLVGTPVRRVDGPAIVTGAARYGTDLTLPGLLYASVDRAPRLGATLIDYDRAAVLARPGVRRVVPVNSGIQHGIAVVATDPWSAMQARSALRATWTDGPAATFDSDEYLRRLPDALDGQLYRVRRDGDAPAALGRAARRHAATYVYPFQAHAPVEPMNCTAHVTANAADIWVPTQSDVRTFDQVAKVTGLDKTKIRLHCTLMGGAFGRRLFADYAAEAAEISKAVGAPVQVQWTRADDMQHGYFQPATIESFEGGLTEGGQLDALVHRSSASDLTIYDIHRGRNIWADPKAPKAADAYESGQDPWGAYDNPYAIANLKVDCADITSPVPVGPWRAVAYPSTVFGRECFLDELARLAGTDPFAFRASLLPNGIGEVGPYHIDRDRLSRALSEVRERSAWDSPVPAPEGMRGGRGLAASVYHAGSYLAMVAEVAVAQDLSSIRVTRIVTVVDCGLVINPLGIRAQTESAIAWGLTATLFGKMDFKNGAPTKASYSAYQVVRLQHMPRVETHIVPSESERPGGFGEHAVPLVAPAVANAIFAATGRRTRVLPITPASLREAGV